MRLVQIWEFKKSTISTIVLEDAIVFRVVPILLRFLQERERLSLKPGEAVEQVQDIVVKVATVILHLVDLQEDTILERLFAKKREILLMAMYIRYVQETEVMVAEEDVGQPVVMHHEVVRHM
jgi:hypothetical protein